MSGADRQVDAKDAPKQGSGVVVDDDKLRNDALEALRKDSLSHAHGVGGYSSSDLFPGKPSGLPPLGPPLDWKSQFPPKTGTPDDPGGLLKHDPHIENWVSKTIREGAVIGGGVGESFFYGVANLPDHLPAIGTSIIIGGTLAAMTKTGKLGAAAAMVAGAYFTSRFVLDTIHDHRRWHKFGEAIEDTWKTDANFWKNMHTVRDTAGNYIFDTSLSVASGYVGYNNPQLAGLLLNIMRVPPVVPNTPPIFSPALATTAMAMGIVPVHTFYTRYEDQQRERERERENRENTISFDIHGTIHRPPPSADQLKEYLEEGKKKRDSDDDKKDSQDLRIDPHNNNIHIWLHTPR